MISFVTIKEANALDVRKILNKYNGSDVELKINQKSESVTFLRSLVTGSTANDELTIEFIYNINVGKELEQAYKYTRSLITKDVEVRIGTTIFYASLVDTYRVPNGVSFDDLLETKFSLTFNNVRNEKVIKKAEVKKEVSKGSAWLQITVPTNIWGMMKKRVKSPISDPHITVIHLNKALNEEELKNIKGCIQSICQNFGPILIKTGKVCFFEDKGKTPCVSLIESKSLIKFNEIIEEEIDLLYPDLVSKDFQYNPHCTLSNSKQEVVPFITPIMWSATCVELFKAGSKEPVCCFPLKKFREEEVNKSPKKQAEELEIPQLQYPEEVTAETIGYDIARDLESIGYSKAANSVKKIAKSTSKSTPIDTLRTIAGTLFEKGQVKLARRLLSNIDKIEVPLDEKIKNALLTYVDPVKLDVAINAVLEAIQDGQSKKSNDKEEVDALGPAMPGTDHHIVTYTRSPQTQEVENTSPEFSKLTELGKRLAGGDIIETAARTYVKEEAVSLNEIPDYDAIKFLKDFIMHSPTAEEILRFQKYYKKFILEEKNNVNENSLKLNNNKKDLSEPIKNKVPELFSKKNASSIREDRLARIKERTSSIRLERLARIQERVIVAKKEENTKNIFTNLAKEQLLSVIKEIKKRGLPVSITLKEIPENTIVDLDDFFPFMYKVSIGNYPTKEDTTKFIKIYNGMVKKVKENYSKKEEKSASVEGSSRIARVKEREISFLLKNIETWSPKFARAVRAYGRGNDKVLMGLVSKEMKIGSTSRKGILIKFITSITTV